MGKREVTKAKVGAESKAIIVSRARTRMIAYERGRQEILAAVRLDQVAEIKDKAEQLRKYAVQRDDADLEAWTSAVALRAHWQYGAIAKSIPARPKGQKRNVFPEIHYREDAIRQSGVSKMTAWNDMALTGIVPEKEIDRLCMRATEIGEPAPSANSFILQDRDDKKLAAFKAIKNKLPDDLHVGDFRTESPKHIADGSIDLVFTDPPYDDDALDLYPAAASEAARILKPGGSMVCYCGHLLLPDVLPLMMQHLKYWWIGAHVHDGGPMSRMVNYGVIVGFKPLLWFVKGDSRFDRQAFVNDTVLVAREKGTHPWQQAVATATNFIATLTVDGGSVVDFFAGGGTTIVAARTLGRKWKAFENDEKAIPGIMERIAA